MMTVSLPEQISALFADAHDDLPAIIRRTSDDDVQRLYRCNFGSLQGINIGDGTNVTSLIFSEDNHKVANRGQVFDQSDGSFETYNPSIQDDDNNTVRIRQEKIWSLKLDRQVAIRNDERVGNKFVLFCVEEMWAVRLKDKTTLFKHVTLHNILDHLGETRIDGEAIGVIVESKENPYLITGH